LLQKCIHGFYYKKNKSGITKKKNKSFSPDLVKEISKQYIDFDSTNPVHLFHVFKGKMPFANDTTLFADRTFLTFHWHS
jgi:hypothetical protein